jgi:uncharacterized RDD family membrane protein YckC
MLRSVTAYDRSVDETICDVCLRTTPTAWERCGHCGAQRLLGADGSVAAFRRYAGFWRRALAVLIDLVLVAGPFALALALLPDRERLDLVVVAALVLVSYQLGVLAWSGDSWGKRAVRAHVVEDDGRPIGRGRVSAREGVAKILEASAPLTPVGVVVLVIGSSNTGGGVVAIVFGLPGLAGLVWAAFDDRRRALHDRMAGTVCVRGRPVALPTRFTHTPS